MGISFIFIVQYMIISSLQTFIQNTPCVHTGRVVVSVRGMVDNPIYVGDEEQYENIEGYQPTFISGPPQIQFMAPAPYAVTGPPPTLPEPRKGKEFENLAENSTPSADRLSKVSVGDDQNVYVKSEC